MQYHKNLLEILNNYKNSFSAKKNTKIQEVSINDENYLFDSIASSKTNSDDFYGGMISISSNNINGKQAKTLTIKNYNLLNALIKKFFQNKNDTPKVTSLAKTSNTTASSTVLPTPITPATSIENSPIAESTTATAKAESIPTVVLNKENNMNSAILNENIITEGENDLSVKKEDISDSAVVNENADVLKNTNVAVVEKSNTTVTKSEDNNVESVNENSTTDENMNNKSEVEVSNPVENDAAAMVEELKTAVTNIEDNIVKTQDDLETITGDVINVSTKVNTEDGSQTEITCKNGEKISAIKTFEDGSVKTYTYDENEKITSTVKKGNDGSVVQYTYKDGIVTEAKKTCTDGSTINYKYENGKKISAVRNWNDGSKTNYTYSNGIIINAVKTAKNYTINYDYSDGKVAYAEKTVYIDSKKAKITSKQIYKYDVNGTKNLQRTMSYSYNKDGSLSSVTTKNAEGIKVSVDTYGYDAGGDVNSIKTTAYKSDGKTVLATVNNKYTYNREAKPIATVTNEGILITFDKGDNENCKTLLLKNGENATIAGHNVVVNTNKNGKKTETQYASDGEAIKYVVDNKQQNISNAVQAKVTTSKSEIIANNILYDVNGKKCGSIKVSDENGTITHTTYNSDGQVILKTIKNAHGEEKEIKCSYETLEDGTKNRITKETHKMADGAVRSVVTSTASYMVTGQDKNRKDKYGYVCVGKNAIKRSIYHSKTHKAFKICTYNYSQEGRKEEENLVTLMDSEGKKCNITTHWEYDTSKKDGKHGTKLVITSYDVNDTKRKNKPLWTETYKLDKAGNKISSVRVYANNKTRKATFSSTGVRTWV